MTEHKLSEEEYLLFKAITRIIEQMEPDLFWKYYGEAAKKRDAAVEKFGK